MFDKVLLYDLESEAEYVRILWINDCPNPMRIGVADGLYPREVLNGPAACGAEQRFVDAKNVSIPMHVDYRLTERHSLLLQGSQELVVPSGMWLGFVRRHLQHVTLSDHAARSIC
jgi:hypothetical protein